MERDELISWLESFTHFAFEYLKTLPTEKLREMYEERR